jgi:2-isopropylmalate synthase
MLILDTTLREGEQTPGVAFPPHIKMKIAELLDKLGIDIIEVGHPVVSDTIRLSLEQIALRGFTSKIAAHARSTVSDVEVALECGAQFIGIFYCVAQDRLDKVFQTDLSDAISQIQNVISFARESNPDLMIRYTPEDTVRSQYDNVITAARAAVEAGANIISIADTTGYMIPHVRSMYDYVSRLKEDLAKHNLNPKIAVHCHNDLGFALANAIDGLRAGAEIIDVSTMGLGERAGIVDLAQLVTILPHFAPEKHCNLPVLVELYSLVSQFTGIPISPNAPIVGQNAFTHCAGVHTHAAAKNPAHYESLHPEQFGRQRSFALDHMSGISSIKAAFDQLSINYDEEIGQATLREVKRIGESGRCVTLDEFGMIVSYLNNHRHDRSITGEALVQ